MKHVKTMSKKPAPAINPPHIVQGILNLLSFWSTKYARAAQGDIQDVFQSF